MMTKNQLYQTFSANLKRLRKHHNLTQQKVADVLGVGMKAYQAWEEKRGMAQVLQLLALCELFFCDLTDLLTKDIKVGKKLGKLDLKA